MRGVGGGGADIHRGTDCWRGCVGLYLMSLFRIWSFEFEFMAALSRLEFTLFLIRWASCCIPVVVKCRPSFKRELSGEKDTMDKHVQLFLKKNTSVSTCLYYKRMISTS